MEDRLVNPGQPRRNIHRGFTCSLTLLHWKVKAQM